ncbi:MAG: DUF4956 domain-containing protein, partial [Rikenellaceae bacterium]
ALANKKVSYTEILFTNCVIIAGLWLLEKFLNRRNEASMRIIYEDISKVNIEKYDELLEDLRARTGFDIHHFQIQKIDYLRDVASIMIYFHCNDNNHFVADNRPEEEEE